MSSEKSPEDPYAPGVTSTVVEELKAPSEQSNKDQDQQSEDQQSDQSEDQQSDQSEDLMVGEAFMILKAENSQLKETLKARAFTVGDKVVTALGAAFILMIFVLMGSYTYGCASKVDPPESCKEIMVLQNEGAPFMCPKGGILSVRTPTTTEVQAADKSSAARERYPVVHEWRVVTCTCPELHQIDIPGDLQ